MVIDIPVEPEEFEPDWWSEALDAAGIARGATVSDAEFVGYVGTGQMSRNGRFRLTWSEPDGRPPTVIVKLPSADVPTREAAFESGAYSNEYVFYAQVAQTVAIRTPACWVARYDRADQRCVLVMEDMAGSVQGDQFEGCSAGEADLVIEQAARLHAPRWGDPTLADVEFHPEDDSRLDATAEFYRGAVGVCVDRLGDNFSDGVVTLLERFGAVLQKWALGSGTPPTLVHGDFRPDNFLFGREPGAPPLAVVDWQTVSKGRGATDVAYFIGGAFAPDARHEVERDLVETYRRRLTAGGLTYSPEDCWTDYRRGSLHGVLITVLATSMAAQTERGDRLFTLMANRHALHAIELEALELVANGS